ncbi:permease prefix domain 1-containing protein [Brevibacillus laterosporus]|uniref:permease prefix domain 1-containing protein n=1 Tax=Brevibacillus laterosporus TaxID=1465 RepID=UPI002157F586|nr:permease prefix domain 1-containing protein [Brevibacillus laterosporus]MED1664590.1 permease prefix domain 1-containing protein [Brevibacillus laterosporus]MED1670025.1 permease prefix domain 1-containing protein [Brevibacillus laterosporus]MED1719026.1 permease prefix domain 1-containing protein [Brevibacillus laterosporus]
MNRMEEYVSSILSHEEFSEQDRIELAEEFLDHLHQLQRDYLQAGYSPEEAEQLAIRDFGGEQKIGEELQESKLRIIVYCYCLWEQAPFYSPFFITYTPCLFYRHIFLSL